FKFLTHGDHPILGLFVGPKGQLQAWSYDDAVMSLDGGSLGPPADQPWRPPSRYQHLLLEEGALALRRTEDDSLEVAFRRAERSSPWTPVKGVGRCRDPHATGYDGRLYLACSDSAPTWLLTSKDDGSKWEALAVGPAPSGRLLDLTAGPEGTLLLTTEEGTAHILAPGAATFAPLLPDVSGAEDPDPSRATPQFEGARRVRSAIVSDEGVHLLVSRSGQCAHALVARSQATPLTETPLPCGDLRREDGAVVLVARTEQEMAAPTIDRWRHEGAQWKSLPSIHPPSYARHLDVGGRHALACTDERPHSHDDYAWESSDDGKTWRAIAAPPRCETIRCTTSACVFNGEDLRLGWADDLPRPKVLAPVGRPPPTESSDSQESGGRLRLRCRREGATKPLGGTDDPAATLQSLAASPLVGAVPWAAVLPRGQSATVVFGGGAAAYHKALLPAGLRFHWVLLRSHGLLTLAQSPTAEMSLHLTPWGAEATSSMIAPQPPGADLDGMVMGGDTQDLALGWTTRAPARVSYLTGRTLHDHLRHMPEELPLWEARQIGGAWFAHSPTRTLIGPPSPTPEDEWLSTSAERAQHLMLGASARVSVGGALLGVSLPRSPTDSPRWRGFVGELAPDGSLGELREVSASAAIHAPPCAIGDVAGVALIFDEEASLELDGESHGSAAVVRVHPDGAICLSSWLAREGTILLPASDLDQGRAFAISPPPASVLSATPLRCERP
ncbi:MAG: hypothetical protein KC731_08595, partial [Myxococcales bacterium]|nr:hypothetical protein [Myxococcales bacterium]